MYCHDYVVMTTAWSLHISMLAIRPKNYHKSIGQRIAIINIFILYISHVSIVTNCLSCLWDLGNRFNMLFQNLSRKHYCGFLNSELTLSPKVIYDRRRISVSQLNVDLLPM
jgi:hypothetical protein